MATYLNRRLSTLDEELAVNEWLIREIATAYSVTAEYPANLQEVTRAEFVRQIDTCPDPRTAEQIDRDQHAAEWRETYQSLLP